MSPSSLAVSRRSLLKATGFGLLTGLAGCSAPTNPLGSNPLTDTNDDTQRRSALGGIEFIHPASWRAEADQTGLFIGPISSDESQGLAYLFHRNTGSNPTPGLFVASLLDSFETVEVLEAGSIDLAALGVVPTVTVRVTAEGAAAWVIQLFDRTSLERPGIGIAFVTPTVYEDSAFEGLVAVLRSADFARESQQLLGGLSASNAISLGTINLQGTAHTGTPTGLDLCRHLEGQRGKLFDAIQALDSEAKRLSDAWTAAVDAAIGTDDQTRTVLGLNEHYLPLIRALKAEADVNRRYIGLLQQDIVLCYDTGGRSVLEKLKKMAFAAGDVYNPAVPADRPLEYLSISNAVASDATSGFRAGAYYDPETETVIVSYAGTNPLDIVGDLKTDLDGALGLNTRQAELAVAFLDAVRRQFPEQTIEITGHSLGGRLAELVAIINGSRATTFNPAGVHRNEVERFTAYRSLTTETLLSNDRIGGRVTSVSVKDEFLTGIQETLNPKNSPLLPPKARGTKLQIGNGPEPTVFERLQTPGVVGPRAIIDAIVGVGNHLMDSVTGGLDEIGQSIDASED